MRSIKKLIIVAVLMASAELAFAQVSIGPEVTPPENFGALSLEDLGPVFAHPLPEDQPPHPAPVPPKVAEKQPPKNDILSLFQNEKPKVEEKNPLEEEAKNEMRALEDPEGPKLPEQMLQLGENNNKQQNEMKELEDPQGPKLPEQMLQLGENSNKQQNEMKGLDDPEGPKLPEQIVQVGENSSKQPELTIKAENAPKEIELDSANDSKSLPTILR